MRVAAAGRTTVARVPLTEALALGPAVWDRLHERSGSTSPFTTWAWLRACADAVTARELEACQAVIVRDTADDVAAVFPFRVWRDRFWGVPVNAIGWAFGDLGCPDHLDLLASPEADLDVLARAVEELPWVALRLGAVAEDAGNLARFGAACERRGWTVRRAFPSRCLYLDLPESWEAFLSTLTSHGRHGLRRKERKLNRDHAVTITDYGSERVEEGLEHLRRLHALRWGGGGAFRDPVADQLHRRLAARLAEQGRLWLVTLDLGGTPAAAWYGFEMGDCVYHYQSGRDPRWERDRVGTVLTGMMIRRAIERGLTRLDFLRGEEAYKAEWTRTWRHCYELMVFRTGWSGAALRWLDRLERPLRGRGLRGMLERVERGLNQSR